MKFLRNQKNNKINSLLKLGQTFKYKKEGIIK